MEGPKKKVRYVQKSLLQFMKKDKQSEVPLSKKEEHQKDTKQQKPKQTKTQVINVKVANLRKQGYQSLVDWLKQQNHVYVGRHNHYVPGAEKSKWSNPFKVDHYGRDQCINRFKQYLLNDQRLMSQLGQLKGKVLGCWCAPQNCHGYVLAELADSFNE